VVSRSFSARLPYAVGEGPHLFEMRCDGYRVFTSSTLALNTMRLSGLPRPSKAIAAWG